MMSRRVERIGELLDAAHRARLARAVLVRVCRIRRTRTGTRCELQYPDGKVQVAWCVNLWPRRRELLVVRGRYSDGGRVFYMEEILEVLRPSLWRYRLHLS